MSKNNQLTQEQLIKQYYTDRPNEDVPHAEAVDWLTKEWERRTGKAFGDPYRAIRKLAQAGFLVQKAKGVYCYHPDAVNYPELWDFSEAQKAQIKRRDNYRCVICGLGEAQGLELHVDHIRPKDKGGEAKLENGQTLCSRHNFLKKNLNQTETGKKMLIQLYELAKSEGNELLVAFCTEILQTFDKHNINGHIIWEK